MFYVEVCKNKFCVLREVVNYCEIVVYDRLWFCYEVGDIGYKFVNNCLFFYGRVLIVV